jgi:hypothetical protein
MEKVEIIPEHTCWEWIGVKSTRGYGRLWVNSKMQQAHRISWELFNEKEFPKDKVACHSCDNPGCVNPKHIWVGNQSENILDAYSKGRRISSGRPRPVFCKNGHLYTEQNSYFEPVTNYIHCKICKAIACKKWRKSKMLLSIVFLFITSCAGIDIKPPPNLENRTLRISSDKPSFEYQYQVCTKTVLGRCTRAEFKKDLYDLNDPVIRQRLIDMGFVLKVREKLQP